MVWPRMGIFSEKNSMIMKRKIIIGISFAGFIVLGFVMLEIFLGPRGLFSEFDRSIHAKYQSISEGQDKKQVMNDLGKPFAKNSKFNLPQRQSFEHFFEAAEKSSAVEYYLWVNGSNWYYCVGFDATGAVITKGEGHS